MWCDEHSHSQASQALTGNKWTKREYWVGHLIMSCINSCLYHKSTIVSLMSVINLSCRLKVFHGDSTVTKNKGPTLFMPEHKEDLYNVVLDWLVCIWRLVGVNVNGIRWSREEGDIQESPLGCESISFGLRRSGTTSPYTTRDLHLLPPVILLLHLHTVPPSPGGGFTIRHAGWKVMETQFVLSDGKCGVGVVADQQRRLWWQLHFILTSWTFCSTHYISFRKWTNTQICRIR